MVKKSITIKSCVSYKARARNKWRQGIYVAKQTNLFKKMGLSEYKIGQIIKKNREPLTYGD